MPNNSKRMAERKAMRVKVSVQRSKMYPLGWFWYATHIPPDQHGEWNVYNNWYCRCQPCKDANALHGMEVKYNKSK